MSGDPLRIVASPVEPPADRVAVFRDRIAGRSAEFDATFPHAVNLEARVLCAMHSHLHRVAGLLRGIHAARRFVGLLLGEQHLPLADLCRLATDPTREARAAVRAALVELAAAIGYRLEPIPSSTIAVTEALARLQESHGGLSAEGVRAVGNDGVVTADEVPDIEARIAEHEGNLSKLKGALEQIKGGGAR
jgi:hypothetical protein